MSGLLHHGNAYSGDLESGKLYFNTISLPNYSDFTPEPVACSAFSQLESDAGRMQVRSRGINIFVASAVEVESELGYMQTDSKQSYLEVGSDIKAVIVSQMQIKARTINKGVVKALIADPMNKFSL